MRTEVVDDFVQLPVFRKKHHAETAKAIQGCFTMLDGNMDSLLPSTVASFIGRSIGLQTRKQYDAVLTSMDDVFDKELTPQRIRKCAYRLAVNLDRLTQGLAVPAKPYGVEQHWCRGVISSFEFFTDNDKPRVKLAFRIWNGPLATRQHVTSHSKSFLNMLYGLCTGFPRKCGYRSPYQLIRMQLAMNLSVHEGKVLCHRLAVSKSQRTENASLARKRQRNCYACPLGFAVDCIACKVGPNECDRSVRTITTNFINPCKANQSSGDL